MSDEGVSPAMLVNQATLENAADLYEQLRILTLQEEMPDPMRRDTRARMTDLRRRFPQAFMLPPVPED